MLPDLAHDIQFVMTHERVRSSRAFLLSSYGVNTFVRSSLSLSILFNQHTYRYMGSLPFRTSVPSL